MANAKGYVIYRSVSGGSYRKVKTVGKNARSFRDKGLKAGKTYAYKVAAYVTDQKKNICGPKSAAVKKKI